MIKNNEPLSMPKVLDYLGKDEAGKELSGFIKKFTELKPKEAEELEKKINSLNIIKLNKTHICKIVDFLPKDEEDLSKVLVDANLNEDESKKILETIKEFI